MDEFETEWQLLQQNGLKDSALRREYEQKVAALCALPPKLAAAGQSEAEIARTLHELRRELGPTFEMLCKTKSYRQIIDSAARTIENLDNRLTLEDSRAWYKQNKP